MTPLLERLPRRTVLRAVLCLSLVGIVLGVVAFAMAGRAGSTGQSAGDAASTSASASEGGKGAADAGKNDSRKSDASKQGADGVKNGASSQAGAGETQQALETLEPDSPRYEVADGDGTAADETSEGQPSEPVRLTIPEGAKYEPDVVLVSVSEGATPEQVNEAIAQSGVVVSREVSADEIAQGYISLDVAEGSSVEDAMNELVGTDAIDGAQPNYIYYAMLGDESDLRARLSAPLAPRTTGRQASASGAQATASGAQTTSRAQASVPGAQITTGAQATDLQAMGSGSQTTSGEDASAGNTSDTSQADSSAAADASPELGTGTSAADARDAAAPEGEAGDSSASSDDQDTAAASSAIELGGADSDAPSDVTASGAEDATVLGSTDAADGDDAASASSNVADTTSSPQQQLMAAAGSVVPNDPRVKDQWALASMHVYEAWALARCEHKVGIAILDGGAQYNHVDLQGNVKHVYDIATKKSYYGEQYNHGTGVAGIAGAVAGNSTGVAGVSYNADLMIVNTLYMVDGTLSTTTGQLANAINYVVNNASRYGINVRVINLSLGALYSANVHQVDQAVVAAINNAYNKGIVVVAAAGNQMANATPPYDVFPGDLPNVVSVINLEKNGTGVKRADTSNYNKSGATNKNISAPGTGIVMPQVDNAYGSDRGTSFAAPQVTGILALEFAARPSLTAQDAVSILYSTATDIGAKGFDANFGYGEANAFEAVQAAKAGKWDPLPNIEPPMPQATGATRVPVGATAAYSVKDGTIKIKSGDSYARLDGTTLTGLKAGTVVLAVCDRNDIERSTISVQVYATDGPWLLASSMNQSFVADVYGGSVLNSANAILYKSNGGNNQVWLLERQGSGGFIIRSAKSGKVLDVTNGSKASGANVLLYRAGGKAWQRWKIRVQQDNTLLFVNENSGRVLEVDGNSAANKRNIRQATQTGAARQKWVLKKVKADIGAVWDGEYRISSRLNTGFVLDVARGSKANGGNIILYKWKGGANQRWRIQYLGNNVYKIYNVNSQRVLDVAYGSLNVGANVVQWSWGNKANQRWNLKKNGDGSYTIMRSGTSRVVCVNGTTATNNRNIFQYSNANAANRHWVLQQF